MRTYFFGDIHGNSYALERCLTHIEQVRPDRIYCLGDLVGWLPFGDRTLLRMRSLDFPTVAGNHDLLVAGLITDDPRQLDRMQASAYNAGLLSTIAGASDYLLSLPLILEESDFVVVHHSPFHLPSEGSAPSIESFGYLDELVLSACLPAWRAYCRPLIFSGHDHVPAVYELTADRADSVRIHRPTTRDTLTIELQQDSRYWVKAGSVGGPYRDELPVANSVIYDSEARTITFYRLAYPTDRLSQDLSALRFCGNLPTIQRYQGLLKRTDRTHTPDDT
jgi:hypothetical protein